MMPPTLMRFQVREQGKKGFGFWFPLVLLWPLGALLALVLLPFLLVAAVFRAGLIRGLRAIPAFWELLCALRGLDVDVRSAKSTLKIRFW